MKRDRPTVAEGACEVAYFDPKAVAAARKAVGTESAVVDASTRLRTLAHPARMRLLLALEGRELCVCDCAQVLGGPLSGTSQHLKELRRIGAITYRAEGKMAYYRIADERWVDLARAALGICVLQSDRKAKATA
jgi:ArsR family transcriptional regulator, lead/cadmium/zinc/bismuth-responsive transcriptional repressor